MADTDLATTLRELRSCIDEQKVRNSREYAEGDAFVNRALVVEAVRAIEQLQRALADLVMYRSHANSGWSRAETLAKQALALAESLRMLANPPAVTTASSPTGEVSACSPQPPAEPTADLHMPGVPLLVHCCEGDIASMTGCLAHRTGDCFCCCDGCTPGASEDDLP